MGAPGNNTEKLLIPKNNNAAGKPSVHHIAIFYAIVLALCLGFYVFSSNKSKNIVVVPEFKVEMASMFPLHFVPITDEFNLTTRYKTTGEWNLDFVVQNRENQKDHVLTYSDMNAGVEYRRTEMRPTYGRPPQPSDFVTWQIVWGDNYKIPGFKGSSDLDSSTTSLHASCLDKTRFPVVNDSFGRGVIDYWLYGGKSQDFSVFLAGRVMQKKVDGGGDLEEKEEEEEENWREVKVECRLRDVEFKATAAGFMVAAATPSSCHTTIDWWWYN